jgi:hypothetical protein
MTEAEWLVCTDLEKALDFVRPRKQGQKWRLFCAACCRRVWHLLKDKRSRDAIELLEQDEFAFGSDSYWTISQDAFEVEEVQSNLQSLQSETHGDWEYAQRAEPMAATAAALAAGLYAGDASEAAASAAAIDAALAAVIRKGTAAENAIERVAISAWKAIWEDQEAVTWNERWRASYLAAFRAAKKAVKDEQLVLLKDLFTGEFRRVKVERAWLEWNNGTVVAIARMIRKQNTLDLLPFLADALEEAGCDNIEILSHCRHPGPHTRGCWVIDSLLGLS